LSRTDKTKPFWVKLAYRDLAIVEVHDHTAGLCDLPDPFDASAFRRRTTRCRREFFETDTRGVLLPYGIDYPDRTEPQRRRRERRQAKRAGRDWARDY
jgi:hypothetical protein